MLKKTFFICLFFSLISFLFAQKGNKNTDNFTLLNTKWILEDYFGIIANQNVDTAYIIFYENYKYSGNLGCNLFFGEFNFGKKKIKLDYLGATKKHCMNMTVEELFLKVIKSDINHYYIDKNRLFLQYKKKTVCRFRAN